MWLFLQFQRVLKAMLAPKFSTIISRPIHNYWCQQVAKLQKHVQARISIRTFLKDSTQKSLGTKTLCPSVPHIMFLQCKAWPFSPPCGLKPPQTRFPVPIQDSKSPMTILAPFLDAIVSLLLHFGLRWLKLAPSLARAHGEAPLGTHYANAKQTDAISHCQHHRAPTSRSEMRGFEFQSKPRK